ncbi:DNA-formamidopyrimidine glycosylase family protein [Saccharibacillus sp. CPCC 101409]|uniref:Fpg/Nei family DNA glycosylase n=1 Tax=Saccharibacillus sp. CPCC 101409 TaxID=3058041 RepID=UPI002672D1A1|nr:DNA-formamidopyrimidine glycosylase family protein [Saccharibacillus sp. CPCC 101409]MDO3412837.1 DNA-formamidopyrimidine glycosylase family protein [Saccharibacillus sp. CPCC 101409]
MPELPEIEHYRRQLGQWILDRPIGRVQLNNAGSTDVSPEEFSEALTGRSILFLERRGTFLILHLDNGHRLLIALAKDGALHCGEAGAKPPFAAQAELELGDRTLWIGGRGSVLRLLTVRGLDDVLKALGGDPFSRQVTPESFAKLFKKRRGALRSTLTGQKTVSGIGPRYADEIAFAAGLLPSVKVQDLNDESVARLYEAMQRILLEASDAGGCLQTPLYEGDTLTGGYLNQCRVYEREGQPCTPEGAKVEKMDVSGKKAYYCPQCQYEQTPVFS